MKHDMSEPIITKGGKFWPLFVHYPSGGFDGDRLAIHRWGVIGEWTWSFEYTEENFFEDGDEVYKTPEEAGAAALNWYHNEFMPDRGFE